MALVLISSLTISLSLSSSLPCFPQTVFLVPQTLMNSHSAFSAWHGFFQIHSCFLSNSSGEAAPATLFRTETTCTHPWHYLTSFLFFPQNLWFPIILFILLKYFDHCLPPPNVIQALSRQGFWPVLLLHLQCVEWCLSYSKHSINMYGINGYEEKYNIRG